MSATAVDAAKQLGAKIPVIDFTPFRTGNAKDEQAVGKALYEAFRDHGFAYVSNHGIPQDVVDAAFSWVGEPSMASSEAHMY